MLHDPTSSTLFPTLPPEAVDEMQQAGTEVRLAPGEPLFVEGQTDYDFFVVLDGQVRITKRVGKEEQVLAIHEPGEFAGEISILTRGPAIATARAVGPARVLRIRATDFRRMVIECTPLAETALTAMAARTQDVDAQLRQQEKLAALGKLAAGLAHELNNPAAAARRAAGSLREGIGHFQAQMLTHEAALSPEQRAMLTSLYDELAVDGGTTPPLDPLARSDREDELTDWLAEHGVRDSWDLAPTLVAAGVDTACLDTLAAGLPGPALGDALTCLGSTLSLLTLAREVEHSVARISTLVGAMRDYSYMDQAAQQWVNLHQGLEDTLVILAHRLKGGVTVTREYAADLPQVCVYGSELNQVWTNLIDNAIDAMGGHGKLWLRTARLGPDYVRVEIADDGPGIPAALRDRIWEPFFTTKSVGEGTGLGLDIARRIIVRRHGGDIHVHSAPGETCFIVTLPIRPPGP